MTHSPEIERKLELLLAMRVAVLGWPEGRSRDNALHAIEEMIVDAQIERFAAYSPKA